MRGGLARCRKSGAELSARAARRRPQDPIRRPRPASRRSDAKAPPRPSPRSAPVVRGDPCGPGGAHAASAARGADRPGPGCCLPGRSRPRARVRRTDCRPRPPRCGRARVSGSCSWSLAEISWWRAASDEAAAGRGARRLLAGAPLRGRAPWARTRCDSRRPSRPRAASVGQVLDGATRRDVEPLHVVDQDHQGPRRPSSATAVRSAPAVVRGSRRQVGVRRSSRATSSASRCGGGSSSRASSEAAPHEVAEPGVREVRLGRCRARWST